MGTETYSISTDFVGLVPPNTVPAPDRLTNEVEEQILVPLTSIVVGPAEASDECIFDFDGDLSPTQRGLLDSVVAAHDGSPLPAPDPPTPGEGEYYQEASEGNSSTTSSDWNDKLTLQETVEGGTYEIRWYAETWSNKTNKEHGFRVILDGSDILGWSDTEQRGSQAETAQSGFAVCDLDEDEHTVVMQYRCIEISMTAYIRRARIVVERVA